MSANVLVVGGGGRENAIAWKLSQSKHVQKIFVSPGNAGTAEEMKTENVSTLNINDYNEVVVWCKERRIDLVVVGPEAPLANGISDFLQKKNIPCFGPSQAAARMESSKSFAKAFMKKYAIPTGKWATFDNSKDAVEHVRNASYDALVVKADGLAAGKGVVVAEDKQEAIEAVESMITNKKFGDAGDSIVIEEKLCGEEISVLAFSDGASIAAFPAAQDFKRLDSLEGSANTGGMGAYCPVPHVSEDVLEFIRAEILQKVVHGLSEEECPFVGILYAGLMLTKNGPKVLEFNCRFGDPETQVLLSLMESDLYEVMLSCVKGNLHAHLPVFDSNKYSVAVVLASQGYPGGYTKGVVINGLEHAKETEDLKVFHAGTSAKDNSIVTSGGRVLAVTGIGSSLSSAREMAYKGVEKISFDGMICRQDIAGRDLRAERSVSYLSSGVDIDAGLSLVEAIKPLAEATARKGCTPDLGGFGGIFDLKACGYKDPILVSGTDGVGTKLKVAQTCNIHNTVGIDLVAMSVNDVLSQGAEPLFFLDYVACGKLDSNVIKQVVTGVAQGCALAGCALLGGETAEMPGMYSNGEYDLAGFAVGAVERNNLIPRKDTIIPGNVLIGLASSGLHSNGFSMVRKIFELSGFEYNNMCPFGDSLKTCGEEFLTPTKIYIKSVLPLIKQGKVKACAHITGGGLLDNLPRVFSPELSVRIDGSAWNIPAVFRWLAKVGHVPAEEMLRTFNCGVGFVLIVDEEAAQDIVGDFRSNNEEAWVIGKVEKRHAQDNQVIVNNFNLAFNDNVTSPLQEEAGLSFKLNKLQRMPVGVLISGSGTNLQALIDHTFTSPSHAEIRLVVSNVAGVKGLERAQEAGIKTKVISHKGFKSRLEFDMTVSEALEREGIQLVCLAGFMRILSGEFVRKWTGRLINVHPSLLPSFKGINAHQQVLDAGVRLSGCTVHFVEEEVDAGGIIVQESVPVFPTDTVEVLQERVKKVEHKAFPQAMELFASGKIRVNSQGKVEWL
eukprot:gene453-1095_t